MPYFISCRPSPFPLSSGAINSISIFLPSIPIKATGSLFPFSAISKCDTFLTHREHILLFFNFSGRQKEVRRLDGSFPYLYQLRYQQRGSLCGDKQFHFRAPGLVGNREKRAESGENLFLRVTMPELLSGQYRNCRLILYMILRQKQQKNNRKKKTVGG